MPCEPASRTLPSWDLATLGGVSQIQLFSLRRHPKWRNIWDSVERIQTVYLDTSLPDILSGGETSGTVWQIGLEYWAATSIPWKTIVWLYEIYVYNWQRIWPSIVLSDPNTSRHNSSQTGKQDNNPSQTGKLGDCYMVASYCGISYQRPVE